MVGVGGGIIEGREIAAPASEPLRRDALNVKTQVLQGLML